MNSKTLLAVLLLSVAVLAFDINDYKYTGGVQYVDAGADYHVKANADIFGSNSSQVEQFEATVSKNIPNGNVAATVGLNKAKQPYGSVEGTVNSELLNNTALLVSSAKATYTKNLSTLSVSEDLKTNVSGVQVIGNANLKVDSNQNKDYSVQVLAEKDINNKTVATVGAGIKNELAGAGGKVEYNVDATTKVGAFVGATVNVNNKDEDHNLGAYAIKNFNTELGQGVATAGVVAFKNQSVQAGVDGRLNKPIEDGEITAEGSLRADVKTQSLTEKKAKLTARKNLGNGLNVDGSATYNNGAAEATGNAHYGAVTQDSKVGGNATVTVDLNTQQIVNKAAVIGAEKDFGNGAVAGVEATYVNGDSNVHGGAGYKASTNNVNYGVGAKVDYNVNNKFAQATLYSGLNTLLNNFNVSAFANAFTTFNDAANATVGAAVNDLSQQNKASVYVKTSLRKGAAPVLGQIIGTYTHVLDAQTSVNVEIVRNPENTFELGGNVERQLGNGKAVVAYFKIANDGTIQFF